MLIFNNTFQCFNKLRLCPVIAEIGDFSVFIMIVSAYFVEAYTWHIPNGPFTSIFCTHKFCIESSTISKAKAYLAGIQVC